MLVAQEGVAPHRVCQEAAAAVAVAGPVCLLLALPCIASPILDGCIQDTKEIIIHVNAFQVVASKTQVDWVFLWAADTSSKGLHTAGARCWGTMLGLNAGA